MALAALTRFISTFGERPSFKGMCMGLDAAGKTSVTYRLKLGEQIVTCPTIGFNVVCGCVHLCRSALHMLWGDAACRRTWTSGATACSFVSNPLLQVYHVWHCDAR